MSGGFKKFMENEKREKTFQFISNIFSNSLWGSIKFWGFLSLTLFSLYKTVTYENKFPVNCGVIENMEIVDCECNGENSLRYHLFVNVNNKIEDLTIPKNIYDKYSKLYESDKNVKYCDSDTDNGFIFLICITVLLGIITLVYLINLE